VRSVEDKLLLKELAKKQIPLTVCPLSNLKLKVVQKMEELPLPELLQNNILVTINSDDPAYFGGYVNENYSAVAQAFQLNEGDILKLAINSFKASFLPKLEKSKWIDTLHNTNRNED
jgi:adenosine deaminase